MTYSEITTMIGVEGMTRQKRLFWKAEAGEINITFAQEYADRRQQYIDWVRAGKFAQFGITEKDIVE